MGECIVQWTPSNILGVRYLSTPEGEGTTYHYPAIREIRNAHIFSSMEEAVHAVESRWSTQECTVEDDGDRRIYRVGSRIAFKVLPLAEALALSVVED